MRRRIEEEVEPTVGLQRHIHFVGFFYEREDHTILTKHESQRPTAVSEKSDISVICVMALRYIGSLKIRLNSGLSWVELAV